jgi:alkaline phosphatase D
MPEFLCCLSARDRALCAPEKLDQVSAPVTTSAARDNTGWVQLNGLKPNVHYYYLPFSRNDVGEEGSFRTLPSAEDHHDPVTNRRGLFNFRFQFGSCANQKPGSGTGPGLPAYETMLKTLPGKVHFSIMNGDWLYEDNNPKEPGKPRWVAYPQPHVVIQYYDGRTGDLVYSEPVHVGSTK